jgi:hypothetical protein
VPVELGNRSMAQSVVLKLMVGLEGKGLVVVTDNYLSSIGLFIELANMEIYATGTMQANRIGLQQRLKDLKSWRCCDQGIIDWQMHSSRAISCVVWMDKKLVLLISTHAIPIQPPCLHPNSLTTVPRRNGPVRDTIHTSLVHLEYTIHMHGVVSLTNSVLPTLAKPDPTSGGIGCFFSSLIQSLSICMLCTLHTYKGLGFLLDQ